MIAVIGNLETRADLEAVLAASKERPQFVFKHSTCCPVSRRALDEFSAFAAGCDEAGFAVVRVIESRGVSDAVAARLGVPHESPQVILVAAGRAAWHASHYDVRRDALAAALEALGGPGGAAASGTAGPAR